MIRKNIISKELDNQLRSVTFDTEPAETIEPEEAVLDEPVAKPDSSSKIPVINKRVVTVEYLNKLKRATIAQTKYESIKSFSHLLSNLSIVLLSVSIITYLVFYFVNPESASFVALIILSLEAFALLGITLYMMAKITTAKELSDIAASDFSTCAHIIGLPDEETYLSP